MSSIYELAKRAGVSTATVSRVINNQEGVSQETIERILKLADEMGFEARVHKSVGDTVGVFAAVGPNTPTSMNNPYFTEVLRGTCDAIFDANMNCAIIPLHKLPRDTSKFHYFCRLRNIQGGVFLLTSMMDSFVTKINKKFPISVVDDYFPGVFCVRANNFSGGYNIAKYLLAQGHRKIGVVIPEVTHRDHLERFEGAKAALDEAGCAISDNLIIRLSFHSEMELMQGLRTMVQSNNDLTALLVLSDQEAVKTIHILTEMGIRIPEDISITGFDNLPIATLVRPALTTIHHPCYEGARAAAAHVIDAIQKHHTSMPAEGMILDTHLVIRDSVRPLST